MEEIEGGLHPTVDRKGLKKKKKKKSTPLVNCIASGSVNSCFVEISRIQYCAPAVRFATCWLFVVKIFFAVFYLNLRRGCNLPKFQLFLDIK